jgi:hypothetical protein
MAVQFVLAVLVLYRKVIAVYCGDRAENGNLLWAQNEEDINPFRSYVGPRPTL